MHSYDQADYVVVPVCLGNFCGVRPSDGTTVNPKDRRYWAQRGHHYDGLSHFFEHAHEWLPQLGRKPHVLVWNGVLGQLKRHTGGDVLKLFILLGTRVVIVKW